MDKKTRRVTSVDVARACGVSQATVSYVLNNSPRHSIPAATRERVWKTAQELGYRPSAPARDLRTGQSAVILAVIPYEQVDPKLARILKSLEEKLRLHGLSLLWYVGVPKDAPAQEHPSRHVSPAAIVVGTSNAEPHIVAFLDRFAVPVIPLTGSTREEVGERQVAYLFARGKRRMVYVAPDRADLQELGRARLAGVRQGCEQFGLQPPQVVHIPSLQDEAKEAIAVLKAHQDTPTGICCYNDEVAFAVLSALSEHGVAVPETVAVIGCDDIPLAQFTIPPLTTIGFPDQHTDDVLEGILAVLRGEPAPKTTPQPLFVIERGSA